MTRISKAISRAMEKAKRERASGEERASREEAARPLPFAPVTASPQAVHKNIPSRSQGGEEDAHSLVHDENPPTIPEGQFGPPEEHLVSLISPESIESEHYRALRYTVEQLHGESGTMVLAISSPAPGDGKTLTTLNLAGSLAQDRKAKVLVIDGDIRRPTVAQYCRMASVGPGLAQAALEPTCALEEIVRLHPRHNLCILATRPSTVAPHIILESPGVGALFQQARRLFDYVLVDSSPLLYPECRLLETLVDGFLIVVAANRTPRKLIDKGVEALDPEKLKGLIFNEDTYGISGYYYHRGAPSFLDRIGLSRRTRGYEP